MQQIRPYDLQLCIKENKNNKKVHQNYCASHGLNAIQIQDEILMYHFVLKSSACLYTHTSYEYEIIEVIFPVFGMPFMT